MIYYINIYEVYNYYYDIDDNDVYIYNNYGYNEGVYRYREDHYDYNLNDGYGSDGDDIYDFIFNGGNKDEVTIIINMVMMMMFITQSILEVMMLLITKNIIVVMMMKFITILIMVMMMMFINIMITAILMIAFT